jgi:hypothetical protein
MLDKPMIAESCVGGSRLLRLYVRLLTYEPNYKKFVRSECGLVTVEWVALAAGLVIGCIMISLILMRGLAGAANSVANQLSP